MDNKVQKAVEALQQGEMVVYPTDTAYALGVDATNESAIQKLFAFKQRPLHKPLHILVADMTMADEYAVITDDARTLAEAFLPGPLTLVLKKKNTVPSVLVSDGDTIGIRIPDNATALSLSLHFGKPITTTSANIALGETPYSIDTVRDSFGDAFSDIATVIDEGTLPFVQPSTFVDLTQQKPVILREGPITRDEIMNVLK